MSRSPIDVRERKVRNAAKFLMQQTKRKTDKNMKSMKSVLSCGVVLLSGVLCQTAHATFIEGGTSTLNSAIAGGQSMTVSWSVTETSHIYTYDYTVNDPTGEVQTGTHTPESIDYFSVSFDTTPSGVVIPGSQAGGSSQQNDGVNGLAWNFAINPGQNSPTLSFNSYDPPGLSDAEAEDHFSPSPWLSGDLVPTPVPEATTLIMGATLLLPFGASTLRGLRKKLAV
jgi:hypothetical protein